MSLQTRVNNQTFLLVDQGTNVDADCLTHGLDEKLRAKVGAKGGGCGKCRSAPRDVVA